MDLKQKVKDLQQDIIEKTKPKEELLLVLEAIDIAVKHSGYPFGGFVRHFLVPLIHDENKAERWSDIDIWFHDQENAISFVREMEDWVKTKDPVTTFYCNNSSASSYRAEVMYNELSVYRQQFMLQQDDIIIFDIIISGSCPVNDFEVNKLFFTGEGFINHSFLPEEDLIHFILSKTAPLCNEYLPILMDDEGKSMIRSYEEGVPEWCSRFREEYPPYSHPDYKDSRLSTEITKVSELSRSARHLRRLYFSYSQKGWEIVHIPSGVTIERIEGIYLLPIPEDFLSYREKVIEMSRYVHSQRIKVARS